MDGQPTRGGLAARTPAAWRGFFAFVRRPVLPGRATGVSRAGLGAIVRLLPLDLLAMALLIGGFGALVALGLKMPEHMLGDMALTPLLIGIIVLGAPIGEEIVFRGWLSGRPGHLAAILALALGGGVAAWAMLSLPKPAGALVALGALTLTALAALAALWVGRRRPALGWFQRHFRWFYLASALAFAAVHLTNFGAGVSVAMLPLTLPQFVLGLILGYLRANYGLWSSISFHALHNTVFVGLVLAAA